MNTISIEIFYASTTEQYHIKQDFPANYTIQDTIEHSDVLSKFPEIDLNTFAVGVFGKKMPLETSLMTLNPGDRIEIYRPLIIDPMTKRRLIANNSRKIPRSL